MAIAVLGTVLLKAIIALQSAAVPIQIPQSSKDNPESSRPESSPAFRWLTNAGETRGLGFDTHTIEQRRVDELRYSSAETETEIVRINNHTVQTTHRSYDLDANGRRQLVETVVEKISSQPSGKINAERTTSKRNTNGKFRVIRQDVQEMTPLGKDRYETNTTVFLPDINDSMSESEKIRQVERRTTGGIIELDRTQWLPNSNGEWSVSERRLSTTRDTKYQVLTDEEVYRSDTNEELSLVEKSSSREWTDGEGRDRRSVETFKMDLDGRLSLNSRLMLVQTAFSDGTQQVIQELELRDPGTASSSLRLVEKIVETSIGVSPDTIEKETEVQARDVNGVLRTVRIHKVVEVKK